MHGGLDAIGSDDVRSGRSGRRGGRRKFWVKHWCDGRHGVLWRQLGRHSNHSCCGDSWRRLVAVGVAGVVAVVVAKAMQLLNVVHVSVWLHVDAEVALGGGGIVADVTTVRLVATRVSFTPCKAWVWLVPDAQNTLRLAFGVFFPHVNLQSFRILVVPVAFGALQHLTRVSHGQKRLLLWLLLLLLLVMKMLVLLLLLLLMVMVVMMVAEMGRWQDIFLVVTEVKQAVAAVVTSYRILEEFLWGKFVKDGVLEKFFVLTHVSTALDPYVIRQKSHVLCEIPVARPQSTQYAQVHFWAGVEGAFLWTIVYQFEFDFWRVQNWTVLLLLGLLLLLWLLLGLLLGLLLLGLLLWFLLLLLLWLLELFVWRRWCFRHICGVGR